MIQRAAMILLVGGLLASAGGCGVVHTLVYEPFGPNRLCDATHCDDGSCGSCAACTSCGEEAGCGVAVPRGRWCRMHRVFGCRVCADACDACGDPGCDAYDCRRPGPLTSLFGFLRCGAFCGSGCGERYWGDWYGDPPDCCDPCDNCGNFTGGANGRSTGGCSSCGGEPEYAARSARPSTCSSCGQEIARSPAKPTRAAATAHSPSRAPRIISQTDRAVNPVAAHDTPHLAQPRRAVRQ